MKFQVYGFCTRCEVDMTRDIASMRPANAHCAYDASLMLKLFLLRTIGSWYIQSTSSTNPWEQQRPGAATLSAFLNSCASSGAHQPEMLTPLRVPTNSIYSSILCVEKLVGR